MSGFESTKLNFGHEEIKSKALSAEGGDYKYEEFESEAILGLQAGRGLLGTDGVLTGLIQRLVNAALSGEMNRHLKGERSEGLPPRLTRFCTSTILATVGNTS